MLDIRFENVFKISKIINLFVILNFLTFQPRNCKSATNKKRIYEEQIGQMNLWFILWCLYNKYVSICVDMFEILQRIKNSKKKQKTPGLKNEIDKWLIQMTPKRK